MTWKEYFTYPPRLSWKIDPRPDLLPGISGKTRFSINSQGLRGDLFTNETQNILLVGGSTTENVYLDDKETWTSLLAEKLKKLEPSSESPPQIALAALAKSGLGTPDHTLQIELELKRLPPLHAVVFLIGVNDFLGVVEKGDSYYSRPAQQIKEHTFSIYPRDFEFTLRGSAWWDFLRRMKWLLSPSSKPNQLDGSLVQSWREQRHLSPKTTALPPLHLQDYTHSILRLSRAVRAMGAKPLFLTQPFSWRKLNSPQEENLFWMGWSRDKSHFLSSNALFEGMSLFNQTLLKTCTEHRCIDLALEMQTYGIDCYYDGVHFNEKGAQKIAEILFRKWPKIF